MELTSNAVTIYSDGSCRGNPGPGGWGVVVIDTDTGELIDCFAEQSEETTNNREEMKAIIFALERYGVDSHNFNLIPIIYSDSSYCVNTFNDWMWRWERNNWIKSDKKIPENLDLVKTYYNLIKVKSVELRKVKGHANIKWNEVADALATGRMSVKEVKEKYGNNSGNSDN